jgi:hypothetical protein
LAIAALAGCGSDDDAADAEATSPDAGSVVSTEPAGGGNGEADGSSEASSDGSVDAVEFPIPAPQGLVLDALADAGIPMDSQRQLYYENDDFDRVVAFYDDWTSRNGEWSRGEAEGTVVFQDISGSALQSITIAPNHDPGAQADGPVTFVLLVTDQ